MTKLEAMDERRSRRLYLTEPINASLLSRLQNLIDTYNIKAHFKLATGGRFERGNPANYVL